MTLPYWTYTNRTTKT